MGNFKKNLIIKWWKGISPLIKGGIIGILAGIFTFIFFPILIRFNPTIYQFFQSKFYEKIMIFISSMTGCSLRLFECAEEETIFWLVIIILVSFAIGVLVQFVRHKIK